jgi:acetate kinase
VDLAPLRVLVVNAGSTSLKLHVVEGDESRAVDSLEQDVDAVAHRVVHGGPRFREPVLIDDDVHEQIRAFEPLAPLHNAPAHRGIAQAREA